MFATKDHKTHSEQPDHPFFGTTTVYPKLTINAPNDRYEQEADSIADRVMRQAGDTEAPVAIGKNGPGLQRKCAACEKEEKESIQRKSTPDSPQMMKAAGGGQLASPALTHQLQHSKGRGQALPESTNQQMGRAFGADFSAVRIHTDSHAAQMNQGIQARAFTHGSDIYFNRGHYQPGSAAGDRLLAHELTHVVQQNHSSTSIQRSIDVMAHDTLAPNAPGLTRGQLVGSWLQQLCPDGNWGVNGAGFVSAPNRADFCNTRRRKGVTNLGSTHHKTSCECLCDATTAAAPTIRVQAGSDTFFSGGNFISIPIPLTGTRIGVNVGGVGSTLTGPAGPGEGTTQINPNGSFDSGISGHDPNRVAGRGIPGAADTAPHAGAGRGQTIRDPAWVIFGHEVCGHVMNWHTEGRDFHAQTPEGDTTAVDIENRIRREHSTPANNLGIRTGNIAVTDAAGNPQVLRGSIFEVRRGDTLFGIARRLGIARADIFNSIFRPNGNRFTVADQDRIATGERLLVANVFYHEVISGDTLSDIARTWALPLRSVLRANPGIANPDHIVPGQRIVIPNS